MGDRVVRRAWEWRGDARGSSGSCWERRVFLPCSRVVRAVCLEESGVIECHWTLAEWRNSESVRGTWNGIEQSFALPLMFEIKPTMRGEPAQKYAPEISIDRPRFFVTFPAPSSCACGNTGHNSSDYVVLGDHNNTQINPVFRGMAWNRCLVHRPGSEQRKHCDEYWR